MDQRTRERVDTWDARPFDGGFAELTTLAANGFSGAVTASGAWLFMLNGRVVGVFDGEMSAFESASGTVYAAPNPALPLLCSMHERGGERRGRYYTNETPLSEVDGTLQDGAFTGYVELSEQVLSGDYYLVYYGGRRMAVAFIGNAGRLLTGEEAFERAADEVGIYDVIDVTVEVTDVPTPADSGPKRAGVSDDVAGGSEADDSTDEPGDESVASPVASSTRAEPDAPGGEHADEASIDDRESPPTQESASSGTGAVASDPDTGPADSTVVGTGSTGDETGSTGDETDSTVDETDSTVDEVVTEPTPARESAADAPSEPTTPASEEPAAVAPADTHTERLEGGEGGTLQEGTAVSADTDEAASVEPDVDTVEDDADPVEDDTAPPDEAGSSGMAPAQVEAAAAELDERGIDWSGSDETPAADESAEAGSSRDTDPPGGVDDDRLEREAQWRETRTIPSIDPANSTSVEDASEPPVSADPTSTPNTPTGEGVQEVTTRTAKQSNDPTNHSRTDRPESTREDETGTPVEALEATLDSLRDERDRLESALEAERTERETLETENANLHAELQEVRASVEQLERELERERTERLGFGEESDTQQLPPERALAGTNLFVRYETKREPTLETAHDGEGGRDAVAANLRLEHHTEFDSEGVTVTGRSFTEFLESSMAYRFVDWLTETLLFEIRDTGHADDMSDLYDAIPRIDRIELDATVPIESAEAEMDAADFDVVAFDKMGTPLIVATLVDSRRPASEERLTEMEAAASAIKAQASGLGAAIVVTSSFFAPDALTVAEEATAGGFLSRGSKQSYVTISRKTGYHLCLVESRAGGFHMTVPEL